MMRLEPIKVPSKEFMESIGFYWHTDENSKSYIADVIALVSESEAEAYYEATNELYDMFAEAGEYVIQNNLFHELGIPFNLVKQSK